MRPGWPSPPRSPPGRARRARAAPTPNTSARRTTPTGRWRGPPPTQASRGSTSVRRTSAAGRPTSRSPTAGPSRRIYAGYATSGVWQTDDDGVTWTSIFDAYASTSIGDLAVAPSNPDILWVGTGEANIFRASMPGVGIYKSTDAGRTFAHMGLSDTQTIARVIVHPTNADTVFVAASGHEWTDNEKRGVFKTTDGGRTWKKVFYRSPRTGAIDLVMDPANPNTLYASMWQRVRRKWSDPRVEPGYNEGGIWKTTDGGNSWTEINTGLPAAQFRGRIGIDVSRSNPDVLYAFVDNYEPGRPPRDGERDAYARPIQEARIKAAEVYRTDDKGATWRKVSESNDFMSGHSGTYGWVFGQIRVDPKDESTIYTMGLSLNVSRDAGKTFTILRGMHGDHHGLWIDPANSSVLYNANDGGFYQSADAGVTWKFAVSAGGAQFYNVTLDNSTPAVGLRFHSGHWQPPRQGRRRRRARQDSRGRMGERARRRGLVPGRRSREPEHRLLARLLRKLHARRPQHPGAAARPRCRPGRRARGRGGTARRPRRPAAQHAHPSPATRTSARSGWRRFSSRRTTRAPSTPASSTSSARSIAAPPGRRSAPT